MTFYDFPDLGNGLRLVGDPRRGQCHPLLEEQFRVEGWRDYGVKGWMPTLAGLQRWSQLRRQRAAEDLQARSTLGPELDMTEYFDALDDGKAQGFVRRK